MTPQLAGILAAIYASYARIEGMKAANMQRFACNEAMAYGDQDFGSEADHLDRLSVEAHNAQGST